jgi:hypothetical protein
MAYREIWQKPRLHVEECDALRRLTQELDVPPAGPGAGIAW